MGCCHGGWVVDEKGDSDTSPGISMMGRTDWCWRGEREARSEKMKARAASELCKIGPFADLTRGNQACRLGTTPAAFVLSPAGCSCKQLPHWFHLDGFTLVHHRCAPRAFHAPKPQVNLLYGRCCSSIPAKICDLVFWSFKYLVGSFLSFRVSMALEPCLLSAQTLPPSTRTWAWLY